MSTPIVVADHLYLGNSNGIVRCFGATSGEKVYERRLPKGAGIIASLVSDNKRIFCASEDGNVYVLDAGPEFNVVATNPMGDPILASPAISAGVLYVRTIKRLVAIK
jgi:outer membrane protein assembly factor BamB